MGGFVISPPDSGKTFPVNDCQLLWLLRRGYIEVPSISVKEIEDKSKADSLLKSIAILQAVWFLVQCIGRWVQSLPITTLEVTTIAYISCMVPCQLLWWCKPYNVSVGTPLRILAWPPGTREELQDLSPKEGSSFWRKRELVEFPRTINFMKLDQDWITEVGNPPNWFWTGVIGVIFGGVHCIGWNFHFATVAETLLWRISSLTIFCIPFVALWGYLLRHRDTIGKRSLENRLNFITWLYVLVRGYLVVEVFIAFRSMPEGVYDTVNWLQYVINIS
jgi:hypothetical protein